MELPTQSMENLGVDASLHPWLPTVCEDIHFSFFPDFKALLVEQTVGRNKNCLQSDELGVCSQMNWESGGRSSATVCLHL